MEEIPKQPPGMYKTLYLNNRIRLPTSTGERRISEPPTVASPIKISIKRLQGIGNDRQTSLSHGVFFGLETTIKMDAS